MRILSIHASNIQPIQAIAMDDLSDVVVLAGPNGVGKTRFLSWLLNFFQNPVPNPTQWLILEATNEAEKLVWKKNVIDTRELGDIALLRQTLQKNRRRAGHSSSVLNFESNRSIIQIQPFNFTWDYADPFSEDINWSLGFNSLASRFNDTVHSIFRKVRSRREALALRAEELIQTKRFEENSDFVIRIDASDFPDPLLPFKDPFSQLLAPKVLVEPEPRNQQLFYSMSGHELPLTSLSSGEREVVNIVFDFILRNPNDCIVIFDEPELHLHPELSYKLLQTLRNAGHRNQFIFCTHSAEIISASLDYSVIFISPPKPGGGNQAVQVREEDETHQALKLMGQSIGIVSLGKKIVLIEGEHGSLDKQTYGAILKGNFPDLVLVPSGGKGLIQSFHEMVRRILDQSVWGVQFFMLCDRDVVPASRDVEDVEETGKGRIRVLDRYHLENYFLEEDVIAELFRPLESEDSWLCSPQQIRACLMSIAKEYISYSAALITSAHFREKVGNIDILPKGCHSKTIEELQQLMSESVEKERTRFNAAVTEDVIKQFTSETMRSLQASFDTDKWKELIPGRTVLKVFCSSRYANFDFGRFKVGYLKAASDGKISDPFSSVKAIFREFSDIMH